LYNKKGATLLGRALHNKLLATLIAGRQATSGKAEEKAKQIYNASGDHGRCC
jgi:hypothetical protein